MVSVICSVVIDGLFCRVKNWKILMESVIKRGKV